MRFALLVATLLLAGCASDVPRDASRDTTTNPTGPSETEPAPTSAAPVLEIRGIVTDPTIRPLAGASVRLIGPEEVATTDADGKFVFRGVEDVAHRLQAHAPGYVITNLTVAPHERLDVRIVLPYAPNVTVGYSDEVRFDGVIQCALEAFIITPSCDNALVVVPDEDKPFKQNYSFAYGVDLDWKTQVVDVVFDLSAHPAVAGLRVVVRGNEDGSALLNYTQFGRFIGKESFTFRLEPDGNYTDGERPLPGNFTGFILDVYPHSNAYRAVCDPRPGEKCFMGAAATIDLEFTLFVTTFYGTPAPEGYTAQ